jgi:hypothetical protein
MILGLFAHTKDGEKALGEVLAEGIEVDRICVVGDLGAPAGTEGALRHVTLDGLHVPAAQRGEFMETVREGGVVLAVAKSGAQVEEILRRCGATVVEWTGDEANPSHNVAG